MGRSKSASCDQPNSWFTGIPLRHPVTSGAKPSRPTPGTRPKKYLQSQNWSRDACYTTIGFSIYRGKASRPCAIKALLPVLIRGPSRLSVR